MQSMGEKGMRGVGNVQLKGLLGWGGAARIVRWGSLSLLLLGLGACATAPDNPMTVEQRQALHITEIAVDLKPDAKIWWGDAERDFAASKGCVKEVKPRSGSKEVGGQTAGKDEPPACDYDALISSPEAKTYLESRAVAVLEKSLVQQVQPSFTGTAPAKLSEHIFNLHIVSAGQALLLGGNHMLQADFEVMDIGSGKQLVAYPGLLAIGGYGAGGLIALAVEAGSSDPYERLSAEYATAARSWLRQEEN
jgi:hypothetical protein